MHTKLSLVFFPILIPLLICHFSPSISGCTYSVRDVAFVDINPDPYLLYCYTQSDTPQDVKSILKQASYSALMESNVEFEMLEIAQEELEYGEKTAPMKYLDFWNVESFPSAILVSPQGQSLVLPFSNGNKPFRESVWSAFESAVVSPKRLEILDSVVKSYCVVLLIHGRDAGNNRKAEKAILDSISEINKTMNQMTESIEEPPRLITITQELLRQEKVLLWSLGLNENERPDPCLAVIYGRGRMIGPLLRGDEIKSKNLLSILSLIGASCECGLDRKWMLGIMLPLRWAAERQNKALKALGFDAENPMVKTEISQILSIGSTSDTLGEVSIDQLSNHVSNLLEEYKEQAVRLEEKASEATLSPAQIRGLTSSDDRKSEQGKALRKILYSTIGIIFLILSAGMLILLKARRRAS